ncbi:unnamed protein product, partial [Allacma fusca]
ATEGQSQLSKRVTTLPSPVWQTEYRQQPFLRILISDFPTS